MRSRLLALLALPAAFAVSGLAVAHGFDHAAFSEHALLHAEAAGSAASTRHIEGSAISDAPSHGDDHQHPTVLAGVRGKNDSAGHPAATRSIEFPLAASDTDPRIPVVHQRIRAHGAHAPPPHLRGPPSIGD